MKIVPDTSAVIDGRITQMIRTGEYKDAIIIIPEAVVAELEAQANQGREIGFSGLTELQELSRLAREGTIELQYVGERPSLDQVKLASGGEIDALIGRRPSSTGPSSSRAMSCRPRWPGPRASMSRT